MATGKPTASYGQEEASVRSLATTAYRSDQGDGFGDRGCLLLGLLDREAFGGDYGDAEAYGIGRHRGSLRLRLLDEKAFRINYGNREGYLLWRLRRRPLFTATSASTERLTTA